MKLKTLILLSCITLLFSCKKDSNSIHDYLEGSWQLTKVGPDKNNDQVMETSELVGLPDTGKVVSVFKEDGTGYGSFVFPGGFSISKDFLWETDERSRMLTIHAGNNKSYSTTVFVDDANTFHMLTNDAGPNGSKLWMVYSRK